MKNAIIFCAIITVALFETSSFAKPKKEIIEENGLVVIRVTEKNGDKIHVKAYVYFINAGSGEFGILNGTKENFIVMQATLDKNDNPQAIIKVIVTGKNHQIIKYPKSEKNNAGLYKEMEKNVGVFVKEHGIKQILKKQKNNSSNPLPEIPEK